MSIIQEHFNVNGKAFIRTYSDTNRYVIGGEPFGEYTEAIDPAELGRAYTEGGIIPPVESGETEEAQALTRDINEQTGANDPDLVSATERLLTTEE